MFGRLSFLAHSCGTAYGATPPLSTSIKLTNIANFKMTVKAATPCMKTYGDVLATLQPGAQVLRWQVLAVDGHITRGEIRFTAGPAR